MCIFFCLVTCRAFGFDGGEIVGSSVKTTKRYPHMLEMSQSRKRATHRDGQTNKWMREYVRDASDGALGGRKNSSFVRNALQSLWYTLGIQTSHNLTMMRKCGVCCRTSHRLANVVRATVVPCQVMHAHCLGNSKLRYGFLNVVDEHGARCKSSSSI